MGRYAQNTTVTVERSRAEIEEMLMRYGADGFQTGWSNGRAMVAFHLKSLTIRFVLPIPDKTEKRFLERHNKRSGRLEKLSESISLRMWEQERQSRWRALCLVVKAKLEAVECGISTLENEFLAFIVLPDSTTFGEWVMENALPQIRGGTMPMLMGPRTVNAND